MLDEGVGVEVFHDATVAVVSVRGELDLSTSPVLGKTLEQFGPEAHVVVNMADVSFLDSTSINVILAHHLRMIQGGGSLRIRQPSAPVRSLFQLTALVHLLEPDDA